MLLSFRRLRAAFVAVIIAGCLSAQAIPAMAQVPMRNSVDELTAEEVMSLRRGVGQMMARNSASRGSIDFRRSWLYWANMHAHFGNTCRGPVTGGSMTGVVTWSASNTAETQTWCRCEHGTNQFLTWHRMYLYYFERVLQQAAGDPNLRLPYWDYAGHPQLPAIFREATYVNETGQTVPNPLRVEARRSELNTGTAGIATSVSDSSAAMGATDYVTFRGRLERTPHGALHCAVAAGGCPNGLMGAVPSAALDPIFYLHHANIDRLYECWLKVDEAARLPKGSGFLDTRYRFIDSDGSVRTRRVRDMLTTTQLGYGYGAGAGCPTPVAMEVAEVTQAQAAEGAAAEPGTAAKQEVQMGPVELARGVTTMPLVVQTEARGAQRAAGTATVIIAGLDAAQVPGVLYNVYLANEAGARVQIGVIDFFGFGSGPIAGPHAGHSDAPRRLDFDATQAVKELGLGETPKPLLIFEPTTGLTDSTPEAAAALISPEARVTFRRAWLRLDR